VIAEDSVIVNAAEGLGVTLRFVANDATAIVGEGQQMTLDDDAINAIDNGGDPYRHRDPINIAALASDHFGTMALSRSFSAETGGGNSSLGSAVLEVTSPKNGATVSSDTITIEGRAAARVSFIRVNGYDTRVRDNHTFSQELTLPNKDEIELAIEARDSQGLILAQETRTVKRSLSLLPPPTITAPVGSGGTFETNTDVKITGTAPTNTVSIMVNDYRLQLYKAGDPTWSYIASKSLGNLVEGSNVISVRAIDSAGHESSPTTITITLLPAGQTPSSIPTASSSSAAPLPNNAPLKPGSLTVTGPSSANPFETASGDLLLEGKTSTDTNAVYVNDYKLSLYTPGKNFWNYIANTTYATLKPGRNTYHIVSRDSTGNILDAVDYVIIYSPAR
jgi:hypothetical protein